jgi:hypothetical protein
MGRAARTRVEERFTVETLTSRIIDAYRSVSGGVPGASPRAAARASGAS